MVWGGIIIFFALRFKSSFGSLLSAITDRIKNVQGYKKTKEGHEVTFKSQTSTEDKVLPNVSKKPPEGSPERTEDTKWPEDNAQDVNTLKQLVKSERASRYLWEYRFLNYFLVRKTQDVLDWLISCEKPPTIELFDNFWFHVIPDKTEREAVFNALNEHTLIQLTDGALISVTPKGEEYQKWRGPLPPLPEKDV
jgi:hypothetical protein